MTLKKEKDDNLSEVVKNVKILAGLTDDKQDELIGVLETMTKDQLKSIINQSKVPKRLNSVVLPVTLARYNRLGNEGQTSFSQEGEGISYPKGDFEPYTDIISDFMADAKRGRIIFFNEGAE